MSRLYMRFHFFYTIVNYPLADHGDLSFLEPNEKTIYLAIVVCFELQIKWVKNQF